MTERRAAITALLSAALLAAPAGVRAVVENSPHDLLGQGYVERGRGDSPVQCTECHLPITASEQFPMDQPPPSVEYYGRVGLLCYSCHDGTTLVNRQVDASDGAFHPDSHPLLMGELSPVEDTGGLVELPQRQDRLECTTCHAPHDSSNRPFLRGKVEQICPVCHTGRENKGYGAQNQSGGHPVHETMVDDVGAQTPIAQPSFLAGLPGPYPLTGGKKSSGSHWVRGGHLSAGLDGMVECQTCHPVHGGETSPPRPDLLAVDPVREVADELCEQCHQGSRGDGLESARYPNPGGTTTGRTYHPCDDDESNGTSAPVGIRSRISWPLGSARSGPIICTTCHAPHGGAPNTPALRKPVESAGFCEECHLPEEQSPFHHPLEPDPSSGRVCLEPPPGLVATLPGTGVLSCYACHVAHNAGLGKTESDYIPILRFPTRDDRLCLICHPADNPACSEIDRAGHFMGDPTLATTYSDPAPPIRTRDWPATRLPSLYGGDNQKGIICLSCHVFRANPAAMLSEPPPHFLLANSGNEVEWQDDPSEYLCTGCHGLNPSTAKSGHTHPMMEASVNALGTSPVPPVSYTLNGHLNCDSCHSPHEAVVGERVLYSGDGDHGEQGPEGGPPGDRLHPPVPRVPHLGEILSPPWTKT